MLLHVRSPFDLMIGFFSITLNIFTEPLESPIYLFELMIGFFSITLNIFT